MTPHTMGPRALLATAVALLTMLVTASMTPAHAAPADSATPTPRPDAVPANYVVTPNGWFSPECVITLKHNETVVYENGREMVAPLVNAPSAAQVERDGHAASRPALQVDHSRVRAVPACTRPHFDAQGRRYSSTSPDPADTQPFDATNDGWKAKTDVATSYGLGHLSATWNVPDAPAVDNGQTIFYFPGLENRSGPQTIILQPVMAWFQGHWMIASWHCCAVGNVFHSEYIPVTGRQVAGTTQGYGCHATTGACDNWVTVTQDVASGQSTTFTDSVEGRKMDWAFSAALEVYGVSSCQQLPVGPVTFSNVELDDVNGLRRFLTWNTTTSSTSSPDCGYRTTATWNSSTVYQHN